MDLVATHGADGEFTPALSTAGAEAGDLMVLIAASESGATLTDDRFQIAATSTQLAATLWTGTADGTQTDVLLDGGTGQWVAALAMFRNPPPADLEHLGSANGTTVAGDAPVVHAVSALALTAWGGSVAFNSGPAGYDPLIGNRISGRQFGVAIYEWNSETGATDSPTGEFSYSAFPLPWQHWTIPFLRRGAPPQRITPREDALLGGGSPRTYPPPRTRQKGNRVVGGYE